MNTCEKCKFYLPVTSNPVVGDCRRYPPNMPAGEIDIPDNFPFTRQYYRCGEWQAREEQAKPDKPALCSDCGMPLPPDCTFYHRNDTDCVAALKDRLACLESENTTLRHMLEQERKP